MADTLDFKKGTLDLMILKTLSWGPSHGYAIARWIQRCTDGAITVDTSGTLYPALYRLEERGLVSSEWGVTDTKREAKFYKLTPRGRKQLVDAQDDWHKYVHALGAILTTDPRTA